MISKLATKYLHDRIMLKSCGKEKNEKTLFIHLKIANGSDFLSLKDVEFLQINIMSILEK